MEVASEVSKRQQRPEELWNACWITASASSVNCGERRGRLRMEEGSLHILKVSGGSDQDADNCRRHRHSDED